MKKKLILVELNEINFEYVNDYISRGKLPFFSRIISAYGLLRTRSEVKYEELEPWIQWVTVHTGLSFGEHKVFRLGDIVDRPHPQIFEWVESKGYRVGAVSPMNSINNLKNPGYFVPDPWTNTKSSGGWLVRSVSKAISQVVNDNTTSKITFSSAVILMLGMLTYFRFSNVTYYLSLVLMSVRKRWCRAIFLDLFILDFHSSLLKKKKVDFSTVFLNAGAHIQHHYLFNSSAYKGISKNPEWYVEKNADPILDVYEMYDRQLSNLVKDFSDYRMIIATGLRQVPYEKITYYWRLVDHEQFLKGLGVAFKQVFPRMTRDFLITFDNINDVNLCRELLGSVMCKNDGLRIFEEIDVRDDNTIFVTLTYPNTITGDTIVCYDSGEINGFYKKVAFVAIKNGMHDGNGYLIDTGKASSLEDEIELTDLFDVLKSAF